MSRRYFWTAILSSFLLLAACGPPEEGGENEGGTNSDVEVDGNDGASDSSMSDVEPDSKGDAVDDTGDETDTEPLDETGPDEDADTSGMDAGDVDGGGDTRSCRTDTDSDGLTDCEEEDLCTDPNDGDSDDDTLSDLEELQEQTDPCHEDTDGDGATDSEETKYDLDPNRVSTFNDGIKDGDRWIIGACDNPEAEPVDFYESSTGNWTIALPPAFKNYNELTLKGTSKPETSAVYDDPSNEVAGFLLSKDAKGSQSGPVDALRNEVINGIRSVVGGRDNVVQDQTGGSFTTHDQKTAAIGRYRVELPSDQSARSLRDDILFELAPFSRSDASGLPNSAGTKYTTYQIFVSVIFRNNSSGADQSVISVSIAPREKHQSIDRVKFRMDDLTNTTNISEQVDKHLVKCATFQPGQGTPRAEFYWVLDQSGSMDDDNRKVADFADKFEKEVRNTALDYRLGVTNTDVNNDGHLRVPPGWHKQGSVFRSEVDGAVINCGGANWACSSSQEHGLEAARRGIKYMTGNARQQPTSAEKVRSDANIITVLMSDESAHSIGRYRSKNDYQNFFKGRTRMFSIVGTPSCDEDGKGFRDVALATGGKTASLCAKDLTKTIQQIIFAATGLASKYKLPQTPISSSLRVYINGRHR